MRKLLGFILIFVFLVAVVVITAVIPTPAGGPATGANYYCPGKSTLDVVQAEPEVTIRFACNDPGGSFEITFSGNNEILNDVRSRTKTSGGMGVILDASGNVVQLYTCQGVFMEIWPPPKKR